MLQCELKYLSEYFPVFMQQTSHFHLNHVPPIMLCSNTLIETHTFFFLLVAISV